MLQQLDREPSRKLRPSSPRCSRTVLFAAPVTGESTEALRTAESLSSALSAELRVLYADNGEGVLRRHAMEHMELFKRARTWAERLLPRRVPREGIHSGGRDFSSIVMETARQARPELVVVPDTPGQPERWVHDLVLGAATPVLVARGRRGSDAIVAASDLTMPAYPVLRTGALLSSLLHKRLLFVHNLRLTLQTSSQCELALERFRRMTTVGRMNELIAVARSFGVESTNVIMAASTPAEAVLTVAERALADITIVGARTTPRGHGSHAPIAQEIIDRNSRSVLVVPL